MDERFMWRALCLSGRRRRLRRLQAACLSAASGLKSLIIRRRRPSLFLPSSCVTDSSASKAFAPRPARPASGAAPSGAAHPDRPVERRTSILAAAKLAAAEDTNCRRCSVETTPRSGENPQRLRDFILVKEQPGLRRYGSK